MYDLKLSLFIQVTNLVNFFHFTLNGCKTSHTVTAQNFIQLVVLFYIIVHSAQQTSINRSGLIVSSQISQEFIKLPDNGTAKLNFSVVRSFLCIIVHV